jgi:hypothetical protein
MKMESCVRSWYSVAINALRAKSGTFIGTNQLLISNKLHVMFTVCTFLSLHFYLKGSDISIVNRKWKKANELVNVYCRFSSEI